MGRDRSRGATGGGGRIQLESLSKWYGNQHVLKNIDLEIQSGEFFSLLGPSGCGKTTTLRLIGGFEAIEHGSIRIDGDDMNGVPPEKRPVNTVFQNYALFPHKTVADNVAFGLRFKDCTKVETRRRVGEALELVRLTGFESRRPHQLSGGQPQRVALARSLVLRPKVLLLDEPLGALDAKLRRVLQVELRALHHEVYDTPATAYVADFLGLANLLAAEASDGAVQLLGQRIATDTDDVRGPCTVLVRPERLKLVPIAEGTLCAQVDNVVFAGAVTHVHLRVGDHALQAVVTNDGSSLTMVEAGEVGLSLAPDAIRVLAG